MYFKTCKKGSKALSQSAINLVISINEHKIWYHSLLNHRCLNHKRLNHSFRWVYHSWNNLYLNGILQGWQIKPGGPRTHMVWLVQALRRLGTPWHDWRRLGWPLGFVATLRFANSGQPQVMEIQVQVVLPKVVPKTVRLEGKDMT